MAKKIAGALRTHGCWSEHKSSSGRIYYYNYESKQNQWQKPDGWKDSEAQTAPLTKKPQKPTSSQKPKEKQQQQLRELHVQKVHEKAQVQKQHVQKRVHDDQSRRTSTSASSHPTSQKTQQQQLQPSSTRKHSFTEPPTKKPLLDDIPDPKPMHRENSAHRESSKSPRVPLLDTPAPVYRHERYGSHRASPIGKSRNESESPRSKVSNPPTPKYNRPEYRNDTNDYHRSGRVVDHRVESRVDNRVEHRAEHRVEHRVEHRAEHRVDHRVDVRKEHRVDHRADSRTDARVEHRSEHGRNDHYRNDVKTENRQSSHHNPAPKPKRKTLAVQARDEMKELLIKHTKKTPEQESLQETLKRLRYKFRAPTANNKQGQKNGLEYYPAGTQQLILTIFQNDRHSYKVGTLFNSHILPSLMKARGKARLNEIRSFRQQLRLGAIREQLSVLQTTLDTESKEMMVNVNSQQ